MAAHMRMLRTKWLAALLPANLGDSGLSPHVLRTGAPPARGSRRSSQICANSLRSPSSSALTRAAAWQSAGRPTEPDFTSERDDGERDADDEGVAPKEGPRRRRHGKIKRTDEAAGEDEGGGPKGRCRVVATTCMLSDPLLANYEGKPKPQSNP